MYVSLYSRKQLKQTKQFIFVVGVLLAAGGIYALVRELFFQDSFRLSWAIASALIVIAGLLWGLAGKNSLLFRDAYCSMNPERISYRLAVLGREVVIFWADITALQIEEQLISFQLTSGKMIRMRLGNIQQPEVARHVSRSIHLAALEKQIMVNGVQPTQTKPAAQ